MAVAKKMEEAKAGLQLRRIMTGIVVSDKMDKTIVVKTDRQVRHGLYKKYVAKSKKYKAHDEKNQAKIGDLVKLVSCKPMSREKRWVLKEIIRKGTQVLETVEAAQA